MVSTEAVRVEEPPVRRGEPAGRRALLALVLAFLVVAFGLPGQAHAAAPRLNMTLQTNTTEFYAGQSVALWGVVRTAAGDPVIGHKVYVQVRTGANKDQWKTIATTTTKARGRYNLHVRNDRGFTFRTYVKSYGGFKFTASDVTASARLITGPQTLEEREVLLREPLRKPVGSIQTGQRDGLPVRWRQYEGGTIVESAGTVFLLYGSINGAYIRGGGPLGELGVPVGDPECQLPEGGCIQSFSGGAVYHNAKSITAAKTHVAYGAGIAPRLIAVASSQVGYREPAWRTNKYTAWNGAKVAWCGVFQSWVSVAGRNGGAVPQARDFPRLVAEVKHRGVTTEPQVGALAFIDFAGGTNVTHTGLVTKVHSNGSFETIEGNTVVGNSSTRVVAKKHRTAAQGVYFYLPGT